MFRKFLIVILSVTCVMALAACGTSASAETAPEKAAAREDVTRVGWSLGDIAALSDIVSGMTDREYAAGGGAAYKIYEDVTYDRGVVYTVLFNTASVRFDAPGVYDMTYWVYFDAAALKAWADGNGVSLDIPDTGRLAVWVSATVTVTEAEDTDGGDAEDDAAETAEADKDTASGALGDESASAGAGSGSESVSGSSSKSGGSGSSKSASSGSSKSSGSASCSHNWVDEGHYESVLVQAAYDEKVPDAAYYVCNNCGYESTDVTTVGNHTIDVCGGCGYHVVDRYKTVHHDAVYKTQWVSSYKCSKCGATK